MQANLIRERFFSHFADREHKIIESSSLIPADPSILFTVAGMVQFKNYFLGEDTPNFSRAVSCQRCLRVNDLENVGKTARHLSFFEMLGNFSFGDYWKEEAIDWAWEFLVDELQIPKDRLYVSVFSEDTEAEEIWKRFLQDSRIVRLGKSDNFWEMAETGPCGPCSEILYDRGEDKACSPNCAPGCDCDRFIELWNLVFMQFERKANGILNSLPKKNIDTGMGLERLSAVLQGVDTPFETDLIKPVVDSLRGLARSKEQVLLNRIADHIRAICHLIADGVLPGNEERGYVLRNLIRRSVRVGKKLGIIDSPFLYKLATPVSEIFLYLKEKREHIARIIQIEEERFSDVFDRGLLILEEMAEKGRLSGEDLFKLHDTYGFPIDLAEEIAKEKGLLCDIEGFNRLMSEQRERARKKSAFEKRESKVSEETEFVGYRDLEIDAVVVKVTDSGIILDRTPFYPESGGEIGDTGFLIKEKEKAKVEDTQRAGKAILHKTKAILKEGDRVRAIVDAERRRGIEKAHTATHLLHSALRAIVGSSVKQAGSLVAEERLRFDFTHIKPLEEIEIRRAEEVVVEKIMEDIELEIREEDREEAKRMGAIALFEGAYQDRVRVVKISDFSMELCGGCHVKRTGEIGPFIILSETGVAAGIRRIEALVGLSAYRHISAERDRMKDVATALSVGEDRVVERMEELIRREREIERELSRYKAELLVRELLPKDVEKKRIICKKVEGLEKRELGEAVDRMASKIESGVVILVSVKDGGVLWACRVTKDLIERFDASEIVKDAAKMTGGGGGGRRDFATGGGKKVEKVDEAIKKAFEVIKERL